jgi:sec-independent protein translocase protein TatB
MFDFGELLVIGVVALVVLGPERLPQAARTIGQWVGKLQGYVSQVRVDIDREFHLADLRRISEEARSGARSVENAVRGTVDSAETAVAAVHKDLMASMADNGWSSGGPPAPALSFPRRYKPRPSIDDLTLELERLKRQLAMPDAVAAGRRRYAPRSRINRARVRR